MVGDYENKESDSWFGIVAQLALFLVVGWMAVELLTKARPWVFLDGVNFLFHEAGHLIFTPFGEFTSFLGGTIMQLLIPLSILVYFVLKRSFFPASFVLFWLGDNLIIVGEYMRGARTRAFDVVAGTHDWNWIFFQTGLLGYDQMIGGGVRVLGNLMVIGGLLWMMGIVVMKAYAKFNQQE